MSCKAPARPSLKRDCWQGLRRHRHGWAALAAKRDAFCRANSPKDAFCDVFCESPSQNDAFRDVSCCAPSPNTVFCYAFCAPSLPNAHVLRGLLPPWAALGSAWQPAACTDAARVKIVAKRDVFCRAHSPNDAFCDVFCPPPSHNDAFCDVSCGRPSPNMTCCNAFCAPLLPHARRFAAKRDVFCRASAPNDAFCDVFCEAPSQNDAFRDVSCCAPWSNTAFCDAFFVLPLPNTAPPLPNTCVLRGLLSPLGGLCHARADSPRNAMFSAAQVRQTTRFAMFSARRLPKTTRFAMLLLDGRPGLRGHCLTGLCVRAQIRCETRCFLPRTFAKRRVLRCFL